jgi:succinate dehydrogenase/fumarate reductase flavoprotein subunit
VRTKEQSLAQDRIVETDVLVIGGGLAGACAAIEARARGVDVVIVEKAYTGKSGGAALGASWLAVFNPEWGHDLSVWMDFITGIGEYLNNRDWVEIILKESYLRYCDLLEWGVPFASTQGRSPAPGAYAMPLVKNSIMPKLREKVLTSGVEILDRVMVTDLICQDGVVWGAVSFDDRNGDFYRIGAKATIVATGSGAFKMPGWTDSYWTADGDAMSYRAGAEMVDKEFGGKDGGLLKDYGAARVGVAGGYNRYVNGQGEPFIKQYAPMYDTETRRMISSLFEVHAGRGPIFLDFEAATDDERNRAIQAAKGSGLDWLAERVGFNHMTAGKTEMQFGSWVGNQPSQGGVMVDTQCRSSLPGLFAAGDCAGTRMCGACYAPMGYGLAVASVTGHRAGVSASEYAMVSTVPAIDPGRIESLKRSTFAPLERTSGFSPSYLTQTLRNFMAPYFVMQIKQGDRLNASLTMVEFVKNHLVPRMKAHDPHDLRMAHESINMTQNAEMILEASLFRTESRGTHFREDFPGRRDPEWLAWTILKMSDGKMELSRVAIPEKWWPDMTKPIDSRYELMFPTQGNDGI